jgi:hypothetical protein
MNDYLNGKPTTWILPREINGGVPVNIQDQTTQPIDALFAQSVTNFTLSADTVASGIAVMQYTFDATPAHGIVAGNEILLLDVVGNRSFFAKVQLVAVDTITVDRPIDNVFPSATSLGRIVTTEMAVLGSLAAPSIFSVRSGTVPSDITRTFITMLDGTSMDDGKFGGIGALTNGLVFRVVNSFQKTIFNFKTNGEIKQFCYDLEYSEKAPAGQFGLAARLSFAGPDKHGVALRIQDTDVLQWVVQDDLTGLISMKISAQGHLVQD